MNKYDGLDIDEINALIRSKAKSIVDVGPFHKSNTINHDAMIDASHDLVDLCRLANDIIRSSE